MKKIITTTLAVLTIATSGCLNIMQHANGKSVPFSGCGSAFQGTAFSENPIFLLALPFEFVADVITLPYDIISK